ncbi:MAG: glycosyltransferase [Gemmatimonadetes bacterium]|nr:glycosyltransferase [Gemmatimonadota bacterium]
MRRSRLDSLPGSAPMAGDETAEADDPPVGHPRPVDVSIVLPARNEAGIIANAVHRVSEVLDRVGRSWEIVVVDSASEDGTGERVRELGSRRVRLVRVEQPGKGAAIGAGLHAARGRYIGFLDSDLEIDPAELPRFIHALDDGADAAIAAKTDRAGERALRRQLSTVVYNRFARILLGTPYADHQGGMKLFRGDAAAIARSVECTGWFWDTEVLVGLARHRCTVREVPVTVEARREARLSMVPVTLELLRGLVRLRGRRLFRGDAADASGRPHAQQGDHAQAPAGGPVGARPPGRPWGLLAALACAVAILALLHPRLLLTDTTPAGYDLSGHVYPLWVAVQRLLHTGRTHGWSDGWFAGFPLFYFYFPLPAYVAAALTPLLGFAPAFKVMSVCGVAAFPLTAYWLLREMRMGEAATATATVVASGFLFTRYVDLGGNIPSTMGGEFAYGLSLSLSLAYVAALLRAVRRPRDRVAMGLAAVFLAATALSHTLTTVAVVLGVAPLLLHRRGRVPVLVSWALGFLLTAFWSVPFVVRSGLMWAPFPGTTPTWPRVLPLTVAVVAPFALAGFWVMRHSRAAMTIAWLGLVSLLAAAVPQRAFLALRFLPYWYLALFLFAGVAAGLLVEAALRRRSAARMAAAVFLIVIPLHGLLRVGYLHGWAGTEYGGLERGPTWPVLSRLAGELRRLPPGRVYWEDDARLFSRLGSRHILTLIPYWAPGHDALGGLWVESSPTSATVAALHREIAGAGGVAGDGALWPAIVSRMSSLGVRYFIAVHPESVAALSTLPGVRLVGSSGPLMLFEIPAAPLVQAPAGMPPARAIRISDTEIRFHADTLGVPYRIVVSYFPNWRAEGGTGPRRAGTLMSVTPTRPDVQLRFGTTWAGWLGTSLSILAVVVLGFMVLGGPGRARYGRESAAQDVTPVPGEESND